VTTQQVPVPILGGTVVEPDETFIVNLSGQTNATISDGSGVGTILNDEPAGFSIAETGGSTVVTEGNPAPGTTDTFTVVLTGEPASNVVFTITSAATQEVIVQTPTLTFTPGNWSVPQVVTVAGGGSGVDDGNQMTNVTVSVSDASSYDPFDALPDQIVVVTTVDID
jgi:hypothetical protein